MRYPIETKQPEFRRIGHETMLIYPVNDFFLRSKDTLVYLIHLEHPVGHSQHYVGSTINLERRLRQHRYKRKCGGSSLLKEANKRGIAWRLVKVWQASRDLEFILKRQKHHSRFCPVCQDAPPF